MCIGFFEVKKKLRALIVSKKIRCYLRKHPFNKKVYTITKLGR